MNIFIFLLGFYIQIKIFKYIKQFLKRKNVNIDSRLKNILDVITNDSISKCIKSILIFYFLIAPIIICTALYLIYRFDPSLTNEISLGTFFTGLLVIVLLSEKSKILYIPGILITLFYLLRFKRKKQNSSSAQNNAGIERM